MTKNFGCCRYVFNHFLAQRQDQYKENGKAPTRFQQDKSLTELKRELPWLKEADSTSLQASLQDPIPYLDEIIMVGGILSKLKKLDDIEDFISEHKVLSCIIAVGIVILLVQFLRWIF